MKRKYFIPCLLAAAALGLSACSPESIGYAAIDNAQATDARYEEIASYMDDYLENLEMETGGYYSYSARLATGEVANARLSTYWGEGDEIEILNLNIETATGETPIIEYSDEKIVSCWNTYKQLAYPEDSPQ